MPIEPLRARVLELAPADRAARAVDLRIAGLWAEAFGVDAEAWDADLVGRFLRAAYAQGYRDALAEDRRGALCRDAADGHDCGRAGSGSR